MNAKRSFATEGRIIWGGRNTTAQGLEDGTIAIAPYGWCYIGLFEKNSFIGRISPRCEKQDGQVRPLRNAASLRDAAG